MGTTGTTKTVIYLAAATGARTTVYRGRRSRGAPLARRLAVDVAAFWGRPNIGVMVTPITGARIEIVGRAGHFAVDTGRYSAAGAARYSDRGYRALLRQLTPYRDRCLFAAAPDVPEQWEATWALARPWLPQIRDLGLPAAVVAQDGLVHLPALDEWDVLFVGGTTEWKLSEWAYHLVREAKAAGKWTHMGRVNSWRRLQAAHLAGYHSADGTCLAYNPPQYVREIAGWLDRLGRQPALDLWPLNGEVGP